MSPRLAASVRFGIACLSALVVAPSAGGQTSSATTTSTEDATAALDAAWAQARAKFVAGDDGAASQIARAAAKANHPPVASRDRLGFFLAVDDRAYFGGRSAAQGLKIFQSITRGSVDSVYRQAAIRVCAIEAREDVATNYDALVALATRSDDELVLWITGIESRALNENDRGAKAYARLLEKTGGTGPAILHQTYANLLDELKRYDDALAQRDRSIAAGPASWNWNGKGNTLNAMGRYAEADGAYAEAMRLAPDDAKNIRQRARNSVMGGQPENALMLASRAVELSPQDAEAWFQKGRAHGELKQWRDAEAAYRRAIDLNPDGANAKRRLADVLDADGRPAEAAAVREKYHLAAKE